MHVCCPTVLLQDVAVKEIRQKQGTDMSDLWREVLGCYIVYRASVRACCFNVPCNPVSFLFIAGVAAKEPFSSEYRSLSRVNKVSLFAFHSPMYPINFLLISDYAQNNSLFVS